MGLEVRNPVGIIIEMKEREIEFVRYGRVYKRKQVFINGKWQFKPSKKKLALLEAESKKEPTQKGFFDWLWGGDSEEDNKDND